jgi:hypothetical protein
MKRIVLFLLLLGLTREALSAPSSAPPLNCECQPQKGHKTCGNEPAFLDRNETDVARELGFNVPGDDELPTRKLNGLDLYRALARFLEKSDRSRLFYPEYYTRATKNASILTLKSRFTPKNPTEVDEYFRCSIPKDKYCIYRKKLRPYIGLAAKASNIDYSFLACQSYVESRFRSNVESSSGALGYAQIQPSNIEFINKALRRSIQNIYNRRLAATPSVKDVRVSMIQEDIARLWEEFWKGTKNAPHRICTDDLTCYRQAFLVQALSLKTDMLTMALSTSGLKVILDRNGDFRIEGMDKGDSLLLLAGSYNVGVTKTNRLVSKYCSGATKLKECLDRMNTDLQNQKDVKSITTYVMRIRDCSQQFSAEQLDFNTDIEWTEQERTEKHNQQRDRVAQCLLNPCPYSNSGPSRNTASN